MITRDVSPWNDDLTLVKRARDEMAALRPNHSFGIMSLPASKVRGR